MQIKNIALPALFLILFVAFQTWIVISLQELKTKAWQTNEIASIERAINVHEEELQQQSQIDQAFSKNFKALASAACPNASYVPPCGAPPTTPSGAPATFSPSPSLEKKAQSKGAKK
jgi:hypothetical protein